MSTEMSRITYYAGAIEKRHITTQGENHYCISWDIPSFKSYVSNGDLNSPTFTIPNRDKCVWYLHLESIRGDCDDCIFSHLRLVLDRKSDCKEVLVKFNLSIHKHTCSLRSGRTFTFAPKSENSSGILFGICKDMLGNFRFASKFTLHVACDIRIETIVFEDDSFLNEFRSFKNFSPADVVISVGEKNYPVHKAILSTHSSVFAAMFAHNMTESRGVVHIKDMAEDVVEEMIRYIYTGEVERLEMLARDLLIAADKYDLKGLRVKSEEILISSLSSSNAFDLILLAKLHNANGLKFEAMNFITIRSTELMKTSAWESLCQSSPELVREIAEQLLCLKFTLPELE